MNKDYFQYKGYFVSFVQGEWRAMAYANPSFYNTSKSNIKKQINAYLRS